MLKEERRADILRILQREGKVLAAGLADNLGVSEHTIRRDLDNLAEAGQVQRVHGGALPRSFASTSYTDRRRQVPEAKSGIAHAATELVEDGQTIILDGGTTTLRVAQSLPHTLLAKVITNSPLIAATLAEHERIEIVMVGGSFYKDSLVTVGADAVDALRSVNADLCILGVWGLHLELGITVPDLEESRVKRCMMGSSAEVVALASAEKLGTASSYVVGPVDALTYLVTDWTAPKEILDAYRKVGLVVLQG